MSLHFTIFLKIMVKVDCITREEVLPFVCDFLQRTVDNNVIVQQTIKFILNCLGDVVCTYSVIRLWLTRLYCSYKTIDYSIVVQNIVFWYRAKLKKLYLFIDVRNIP